MWDQSLIEKIRSETYILDIYKASGNNPSISSVAVELIKTVQDIYRYLEPSHFMGKIIVCISLNGNKILPGEAEEIQYNKNTLITKTTQSILLQSIDNDLFMWENIEVDSVLRMSKILFYYYSKKEEYFIVNKSKISIKSMQGCCSIYSLYYFYLTESLAHYSVEKILNSSCDHFKKSWADRKQIYFKNKPEGDMQISLREYLSSTLRGVEVTREFSLNAKKPVDIRIHWNSANRSALIEVKWLGVSLNEDANRISTSYSKGRAVEGAKQLKEYLDLAARDLPSIIIKGYLVVIDGRRKNISEHVVSQISQEDGLYYQSTDLIFPDEADYNKIISNFEKPIRMFTRPICQ
ncbi:MAG: hypothetical protein LBE13_00865 [Bacteroidales bacterium]|nr:hypothetical protein [Bacteroidales bacterium]